MWPFSRVRAADIRLVRADDVPPALKRGAKLIDVRSEREFKALHPKGALNMSARALRKGELTLAQDAEIYVICLSGHRSTRAARVLVDLGYTNVNDVSGGLDSWVKMGLPVRRSRSRS